jgi:hypothetical protein
MNQPRINLFQMIRFLADVFDQVNADTPPL